jgi:hypothetical protein
MVEDTSLCFKAYKGLPGEQQQHVPTWGVLCNTQLAARASLGCAVQHPLYGIYLVLRRVLGESTCAAQQVR